MTWQKPQILLLVIRRDMEELPYEFPDLFGNSVTLNSTAEKPVAGERMWRIWFRTGCLLGLAGCGLHPGGDVHQQLAEVSVCEALQNVSRYDGKLVTIRGVYFFELQDKCVSEVLILNRTWPAIIQPLTPDFAGWDALDELTMREARAHKKEEIWVTVSGVLQAVGPKNFVHEGVIRGFGHGGHFPAALVVRKVLSVEIKPKPTYDYSELLVEHVR